MATTILGRVQDLDGDSAEIDGEWRIHGEPLSPCGTHTVVSRSAKNSQNGQKGNGGEDERLREIARHSTYTLYPYGFGMGPRGPLGGGEEARKAHP